MISDRRKLLFGLTATLLVLCALTARTVRAGDTLPICHNGKVPQGIPRAGDYLSVYGMCYDPCAAGYERTTIVGESVCTLKDCPDGFYEDPTGLTCLGREWVSRDGEAASCDANQEQIAVVCYDSCPSGYAPYLGVSCIEDCPSGFSPDDVLGLTCIRWNPPNPIPDVRDREISSRSWEWLHCPSGMDAVELVDIGLWCYDQCESGYTGVLFECIQDCPSGTTDVALTCTKTLISRGAPTIPEVCMSSSFTADVDTSGDPDGFTMLIMNDPQIGIWWEDGARGGRVCADDDQCRYDENLESARLQVLAMNAVDTIQWPMSSALTHGGHGGEFVARPRGVIINGDLTHNFHVQEYLDYERLFNRYSDGASLDALRWPLYPGLGNHEYANNINGDQGGWWMGPYVLAFGLPDLTEAWYAVYGEKGCGYRAVDYMRGMISCETHAGFPRAKLTSFHAGSLAYSWEIGRYHFVQLHNYPSFEHDRPAVLRGLEILDSIPGGILDALEELGLLPQIPESILDAIPRELTGLRITSSLEWLRDDVATATDHGKRVVINLHDFGQDFPFNGEAYDLFIEAIERQNVVGVFAGHVIQPDSSALGYQSNVAHNSTEVRNSFGYTVPYFRCGHAGKESRNYLCLVDFAEDFYNVATLDTLSGAPVFFESFDDKYTKTVPFNLNQPPTVLLVDGDLVLDEGTSHQFAFTFDDPNGDAVEFADAYPDCGGATLTDEDIANSHFTCVFPDGPATFTVAVMLEDDAGFASEVASVEVTVNNVAPSVSATGSIVDENGVATLSGTFIDPGLLDQHTVTVVRSDGSSDMLALPTGERTFSIPHQYLDDNPSGTASDDYTIELTVTDSDGGLGMTSTVDTVNNLDPVSQVDSVTDETGAALGSDVSVGLVGLVITVSGSFTDVGTEDTHTGTIDWGDSTSSNLGTVTGALSADHVFDQSGDYDIEISATDDDLGVGAATATVAVRESAETIAIVVDELSALAGDPNVAAAIGGLQGQGGGGAENGAIDMLQQGNFNAALQKIKQALVALNELSDPDLSNVEGLLALTAKAVAVKAIELAMEAPSTSKRANKIRQAKDFVSLGDALLEAHDYVGAAGDYQKAVRAVQGIKQEKQRGTGTYKQARTTKRPGNN